MVQQQTEVEYVHLMGTDRSHALLFVLITSQEHSLSSPGIQLHLPVSMANLCEDSLSLVANTQSLSGIFSLFFILGRAVD